MLVGGPSDTKTHQEFLSLSGLSSDTVSDLAGKLSLQQSGIALSKCAAVVTQDSGLMHLASCFPVPLVALFGPTLPLHLHPLSPLAHIIWKDADLAKSESRLYGFKATPEVASLPFFERIDPQEVESVLLAAIKSSSLKSV